MAERIVRQPSEAPSLDTVVMQLTPTIERDYCARGVFPQLRAGTAFKLAGSASVHLLSQDDAKEVLTDAEAVYSGATAGRKSAYHSHVCNVRAALRAASERTALLARTEATLIYRSNFSERWLGTQQQLQSVVGAGQRFPAGNGMRRGTDLLGRNVSISRACPVWPLFEIAVSLPRKPAPTAAVVPAAKSPKVDSTWPRTYHGRIYHNAEQRVEALKRHYDVAKSIGGELAKYARGETYGCSQMAAGGCFELPFPAYYSAEVVKQLQQHEAAMRKILDNATPIPRPEADLAWQRLIEAAGNEDLQAMLYTAGEAHSD